MASHLSNTDKLRFEDEIMPHLDVLYRMARSICGDDDLAADTAQEAFLKALKGFASFAPGSNGRSWLARIAHNTCHDHWRKSAARPEQDWGDDALAAAEDQLAEPDWEPAVIRNSFSSHIEAALDQLPPQWRAGILLVDVEGWNYQEAAVSLDIPLGTLRSGLHRARRRLYRLLANHSQEQSTLQEGV